MTCDKCGNPAVLFQPSSGRHLCGHHLAADIESRAKHVIRSHRWLKTGDHIGVILSGDRQSAALLLFLRKLTAGRRDIRLSVIPACDSDPSSLSTARDCARQAGVPCRSLPVAEARRNLNDIPAKVAVACTLDDIARETMVRFLSGTAGQIVHPPVAGYRGIPVICPFLAIPSTEIDRYWDLCRNTGGMTGDLASRRTRHESLAGDAAALLSDYSRRHPATPYALLNLAEDLSGGHAADMVAGGTGGSAPGSREIPREAP